MDPTAATIVRHFNATPAGCLAWTATVSDLELAVAEIALTHRARRIRLSQIRALIAAVERELVVVPAPHVPYPSGSLSHAVGTYIRSARVAERNVIRQYAGLLPLA